MRTKKKSDEPQESMLPLTAAPDRDRCPAQNIAISAAAGTAMTVSLQAEAGSRD